jgi:hypothetical protein
MEKTTMINTIFMLHCQSDQQKEDVTGHVACIGKHIYSALWLENHKEGRMETKAQMGG